MSTEHNPASSTSAGVTEEQTPRVTEAWLAAAFEGLETWKAKPHNAKWLRKIDGTPIPNDLTVCVGEAVYRASKGSAPHTSPSVVPTIRALKWKKSGGSLLSSGYGIVNYEITAFDLLFASSKEIGRFWGDTEAAKAAAQSDFETRLSAALEASRSPVSQKEAVPVAWRWQSPMCGWVYREEKPADWPSEPLFASPVPAPAGEPAIKALPEAAIEAAIRTWMASDDHSADGFLRRMRAAIEAALDSSPPPVSAPVGEEPQ